MLICLKGHLDIIGNESADALAIEICNLEKIELSIPITDLKMSLENDTLKIARNGSIT